jgi:hypothetical protein
MTRIGQFTGTKLPTLWNLASANPTDATPFLLGTVVAASLKQDAGLLIGIPPWGTQDSKVAAGRQRACQASMGPVSKGVPRGGGGELDAPFLINSITFTWC